MKFVQKLGGMFLTMVVVYSVLLGVAPDAPLWMLFCIGLATWVVWAPLDS